MVSRRVRTRGGAEKADSAVARHRLVGRVRGDGPDDVRDPDVVSSIEQRFVAVRVDADRRPDLNERYNLGGWPSTVFLTNGGEVLSGGTYSDAERMNATLRHVADAYRDRAE